ncbi:MAG: MFS transporter, partial [Mycobacterium sp.]
MPRVGRATPASPSPLWILRDFLSANLFFNLCQVMLLLGISWTMTSLTDSPVLISLVQTMLSLPFLLFAIPAGVATDRFGHRVVLLASQFWLLAVLT